MLIFYAYFALLGIRGMYGGRGGKWMDVRIGYRVSVIVSDLCFVWQ